MAFTFFFRDRHTLEHLTNQIINEFSGYSNLKIWDAGCAMGPEPYTFGIILCEAIGDTAYRKVKIHATDIDETSNFKEIVEEGIYNKSELSRMPENIFEKYFVATDKEDKFRIKDLILNSLRFDQHDLTSLTPLDSNYNAIICKNVLLHLHQNQRIEVIKMFHKVLLPGGFLTTEQTQPMPEECKHLFRKTVSDANVWQKI